MRAKTVLVVLGAPIVVIGAFFLTKSLIRSIYVYPTPENETAFFKKYSPEEVVSLFSLNPGGGDSLRGSSSGEGRRFATHVENFDRSIVIRAKDWMPMMFAVEDDISSRLKAAGAQIIEKTGDPRHGFESEYLLGNSFGTVKVEPLEFREIGSAAGTGSVRDGEASVRLHVSVEEKWFRKRPGVIGVKLSVSSH